MKAFTPGQAERFAAYCRLRDAGMPRDRAAGEIGISERTSYSYERSWRGGQPAPSRRRPGRVRWLGWLPGKEREMDAAGMVLNGLRTAWGASGWRFLRSDEGRWWAQRGPLPHRPAGVPAGLYYQAADADTAAGLEVRLQAISGTPGGVRSDGEAM